MKELDVNFAKIESNQFFEGLKTNTTQLNSNLSNSVKEQYKASLGWSYAAKYARIWIEKVRKRKAQREEQKAIDTDDL